MSYTIMTIIGKEVIGHDVHADWRDVIDSATEVDEFEDAWTDHEFLEQVRDTGQALRRHNDGVGTVLRIAFRNPMSPSKETDR